MKKNAKFSLTLFLTILFVFCTSGVFAQMKVYNWETYKTKFKVPSDFRVTESSGNKWSGTNTDITLSIYPRKDEKLSASGMKSALYQWAVDNGVKNIGDINDLDSEKLNGYWGYLYEGQLDGFPVGTMLIVDPDYPDISLYVWVLYRSGFEDTVMEILMSFTPI